MLSKGKYKITQVLDISHSLLMQKEDEQKVQALNIRKCLLDTRQVAYLIDMPELGQDSEIFVLLDMKSPLLYRKNIQVIFQKAYVHSADFIKKLSKKC